MTWNIKSVVCLLGLLLALSPALAGADPVPAVFSPGVISGPEHDAAPAFSQDGSSVWFGRSGETYASIYVSHKVAEQWSVPQVAAFSGHWRDMEPAMAPSGRYLVFISNRPVVPGGQPLDGYFMGKNFPAGGGNMWRVDRQGDGWSDPVHLPVVVNASTSTFAPSIAADGSLYFMSPDKLTNRFRIYRAQLANGQFESPVPLPFSTGEFTDVDPAVSPDESFLVFGSSRKSRTDIDLFLAFKSGKNWCKPVHLGDIVNSSGSDAEPRLSPDLRTLYFSSDRLLPAGADGGTPGWNNAKYNIFSLPIGQFLQARQCEP